MTGLLVVGHGTRVSRGQEELLETANQVAARLPAMPTEAAFLELAEPTIAQSVERLAARGIDHLVVAPLLLFTAGHAKADIPQAVSSALEPFPHISLSWTTPFGCDPKILELSAVRFHEAVGSLGEASEEETLLLMVGRGSSDREAIAHMHEFSRLRTSRHQLVRVEVCFFAKAEPSVEEMLELAGRSGPRRIVVQPHLLFAGQLTESLSERVADMAAVQPDKKWIVTGHLAPHKLLVQATVDFVESALQHSI